MARKNKLKGRYFFYKMRTDRIIRVPIFSEKEMEFVRRARRMFRDDYDWGEFESFIFGWKSPIYGLRRKHYLDFRKDPLYIVMKDMWLKLGIQQGHIAKPKKYKPKPILRSR